MKKRKPDVIDVRRPVPLPPTSEQMAHAEYREVEVFERTADGRRIRLGKAFQRVARFESIEGLSFDERRALRAYRLAFDHAEVSEVKSGLDIGAGGRTAGPEAVLIRLEKIAFAKDAVHRIEARVPAALWPTLRAVALDDKDFKALAMERFGSREVSRVKGNRVVTTIEPRSGTHRDIIRREFMDAARALAAGVAAMRPASAADPIEGKVETATPVEIDPAYLDKRGIMRPWEEISAIIIARFMGEPDPDFAEDRAA